MDKTFKIENKHKLDSEERKKLVPPESVLGMIGLREGCTLLEIGAGTGYFTIPALKYIGNRGKIIAADISEEMIEEIKSRIPENEHRIKLMLCDPLKIDLPDKSIDRILMAFVFHEIEEQVAYLKSMQRLLKENGAIAIAEWDKINSPMGPPIAERLGYSDLINISRKAGYSTLKFERINMYHYLCILK